MKEFNSFENYLKSLNKFQFLTAEEERELLKDAQNGNQKAADKLVSSNLRFVVNQAKIMHRKTGADIEDLISAGNMGLVKAVSRFDLSKKVRFITFAYHWIFSEMMAETSALRQIRLPHNCETALNKIRAIEEKLPASMSRKEKVNYIASQLGMKPSSVSAIINSSMPSLSLDFSEDQNEDDFTLYSRLSDDSVVNPEEEIERMEVLDNFNRMMDKLPEEERDVIAKHYGLYGFKPMSLDEIARSWDKEITREGIRQKEVKAMKRFREAENRRYFEEYIRQAV